MKDTILLGSAAQKKHCSIRPIQGVSAVNIDTGVPLVVKNSP